MRAGAPASFSRSDGFTLVEVMIVVAIIGLLTAIAIPSYRNFRERVKVSEAKANLGAIRVTEHAYYAEYNHFVGNQAYTPDRAADPQGRLAWVAGTRFSILGFAPEGKVYFSYALLGADYPLESFTAQATADLDADGDWSVWTISVGDKEVLHSGAVL